MSFRTVSNSFDRQFGFRAFLAATAALGIIHSAGAVEPSGELLAQATPPQAAPADPTAAQSLDEVVVTAPRMQLPLTIETDPKSARQPVPPNDGAGYLKNIPGFTVVRQGAIDGDPLLRGQGGSRLNVLLDDTPVLGGCPNRMDPPTAYIFPDTFDKLTVLKGPQSVVHGGTALGSVVVDRDTKRFTKEAIRANGSALYGSYDRNDEAIDATIGGPIAYFRAMGTHSSSSDYSDGNGRSVHSKYWRNNGTAMLGVTPDDTTRIQGTVEVSKAQAAYAAGMMDGAQFDRTGVNLQFTKTQVTPWLSKVKFTAYDNYVDHIMDVYTLRPAMNPGMGMSAASQVDHRMTGGKGQIDLTPTDQLKAILGLSYNQDIHTSRSQSWAEYTAGTSLETKARIQDLSFETYAGFGEITYDLGSANRAIGGYRLTRVDATKHNVQPNLTDERNLHAGFGRYEHDITLGLPVTAYVGLGHVERAPDYWERNKTTASFSANTEKTNQLDIGGLFKNSLWQGGASLFYAKHHDYILVPSASNTNIKNVSAHTMGGEAELYYKFLPSWTAGATAAYVYGVNDTENKPLAQTPPLDTTLSLKYDDGTFLGGFLMRAVAEQDRTDLNWGNIISRDIGRTGGFTVFSLNAGWRPTDFITLTGGIDNLFDKAYAEHVSKTGASTSASLAAYADNTRVNEPGRTFWLRGAIKF